MNRHLLSAAESKERERSAGVPSPARAEDGRGQRRLLQNLPRRRRVEKVEDVGKRKAVLLGERDGDAVVGGRRLQLEIERSAEALPQGQSPGLVNPRAERRVDHELHAAALVEEAFRDDRVSAGHGAKHRAAGDDVVHELLGSRSIESALGREPLDADGRGR